MKVERLLPPFRSLSGRIQRTRNRLMVLSACLLVLASLLSLSIVQPTQAAGLPTPWGSADIGNVGVVGSADYTNGTFSLTGSGIVEYTYDKFRYVYHPLYGDGTIVARVTGLNGGSDNAKAGVMIRNDLNGWPPAINAMVQINAGGNISFQRRLVAGEETSYTQLSGTFTTPYWLKLDRSGNTITSYASQNGTDWTQVGAETIEMSVDAWVGLAVTSGSDTETTTATFENVMVSQPAINVGVNWHNKLSKISPLAYGSNGFSALDPTALNDPNYNTAMTTMRPALFRLHYAGMLNDSMEDGRGWVKEAERVWDREKIRSILDGIDAWNTQKGYKPELVINIPSFPGWLSTYEVTDPDNENAVVTNGLLATSEYDAYAAFCAELVRIINKEQGREITYFEVPNEVDGRYNQRFVDYNRSHGTSIPHRMDELATLYNKVAVAMKQVDPKIKVGGPALERPDTIEGIKVFIANTVNQTKPTTLDFFSFHGYASGSASDTDYYIYNRVATGASNNMLLDMKRVREALDSASPKRRIPLWFDEYNVSWTYQTYDERMKNHKGVVFDAMVMAYFLSNGVDATLSWNDADGIYGKIDPYSNPSYQLRPGGQFLQLMNKYGVGQRVAVSTSDEKSVIPFAVRHSKGYTYMLINRTPNTRTVNTDFNGGPRGELTRWEFSADGLRTTKVGSVGSLELPPYSVTLVTTG